MSNYHLSSTSLNQEQLNQLVNKLNKLANYDYSSLEETFYEIAVYSDRYFIYTPKVANKLFKGSILVTYREFLEILDDCVVIGLVNSPFPLIKK